jgi:hypothetical protein
MGGVMLNGYLFVAHYFCFKAVNIFIRPNNNFADHF